MEKIEAGLIGSARRQKRAVRSSPCSTAYPENRWLAELTTSYLSLMTITSTFVLLTFSTACFSAWPVISVPATNVTSAPASSHPRA